MRTGDGRDGGGFVDRFLRIVCRYKPLLVVLLTVEILLVLLSVLAVPQNAPGTGGRIILNLTFAVNVPILGAAIGLIYVCRTGGRYVKA